MWEKNGEANDHLQISNCNFELDQKILVFYETVRYLIKNEIKILSLQKYSL